MAGKKSNAGAPPHYKTPEELNNKIESIITKYENDGYYCNMSLLTADLGFSSRTSLYDYCNRSPEFSNIIKKTKEKIIGIKQMKAEKNEINATVFIFDAKANHGMNDKAAETDGDDIDVVDFDFVEVE